jgi:hypothetical protein
MKATAVSAEIVSVGAAWPADQLVGFFAKYLIAEMSATRWRSMAGLYCEAAIDMPLAPWCRTGHEVRSGLDASFLKAKAVMIVSATPSA